MPWPGPGIRGHGEIDGTGPLADHSRAGDRRLADRLAWSEPARYRGYARLRCGPSLAGIAQEGSRLAPFHRRAAHRPGLSGIHATGGSTRAQAQGGAGLSRDVHERQAPRAAHFCQHREPADEAAGVALHGEYRMPALQRQAPSARIPVRQVRGTGHHRHLQTAAGPLGRHLPTLCGRVSPPAWRR
jgi:hypothetical protein